MKTFAEYIVENILGPNWKKISPAAYEKAKSLHTNHKNGKMFKGKLSDGSTHVQHWTQNASDAAPSVQKVNHKDGTESHWVKKAPINEMTDAEIDAHNDKFEKNVVDAHLKHIHKKYGKDVDCNFGSGSTETQFTSKVYHPKKGTIRVTTHFHPETLKVEKHTEE